MLDATDETQTLNVELEFVSPFDNCTTRTIRTTYIT